MTARRGRGEGGVRKRADGRWQGTIDLGFRDGKRRRKFVYARTAAEVREKVRHEQQRIATGLAPTDGRRTTGDFLRWWRDKVLPGTVGAGSEATYRQLLELYVIPGVGHVRLAELAPAHVTEMMRAMEAGDLGRTGRPLSAQTQSSARKVLGRALRRAEQEGLVFRNAATLADGPRIARREGRSLTAEQARELLVAIKGDRLAEAFGLQLTLGLRRGEALGLRWSDIDLGETPTVHVRHQLQRRRGEGLVLVELKTPQSRRDLALPAQMATALRSWRAVQAAERLQAGASWHDAGGLVFTTPLGTPVDPDNYRHRFSTLTTKCGLGHWSTHELRHSAGSLLFAAGVPMKLVSETLGHSSERVTSDIYVHTGDAARAAVADAMTGVLWAADAEPDDFGGQPGGQTEHPDLTSAL